MTHRTSWTIEIAGVVAAWLLFLAGAVCHGGPFRPWRPSLSATIDKTQLHLGESATVTYSTENATSVQCHITHLARFFGESDGTVIPLSGTYTVTPTEVGTWVEHLRAFRRARDINGDGRADGSRRSVGVTFEIEVSPAEK